jgi:ABC-type lipoprotein release transport system permease subunit
VVDGIVRSGRWRPDVQSLLFHLEARDVATIRVAAVVLTTVGLAAAWIPAWRASRIDPSELLRG